MAHVKECYYFSHDSNARSDPKIMAMLNVYGMEGYGRWWTLIEILREQTDYRLKLCKWSTNALAMAMLCDANSAEKFIHDCIDEFELLKSDGKHFWSESLIRRMEIKEEKRQQKIEAGRKGAEIRWGKGDDMAPPKQNHSTAIAKDSKVKERKVNKKETKVKEKKTAYAENVKMTPEEHQKLIDQFGQAATDRMIEILDNYKGASGKTYKSDYRAILNWVVKRWREEHGQPIHGSSQISRQDNDIRFKYE